MGNIVMYARQPSGHRAKTGGFALPTVLIISIILLAIGASTLQLASAISRSLTDQHWNREAKLAAQAGVSFASSCLSAGTTTWGSLVPNKKCDGTTTLSPDPGIYIGSDTTANASPGRWRSTFTAATPVTGADGVPRADITGKVEVLNPAATLAIKTYTYSYNVVMSLATVASSQTASQVSTTLSGTDTASCEIAADQLVYCSGDNGKGNFGRGDTASSTVPVKFGTGNATLTGKTISKVSVGYRYTCVVADQKIYCAGEGASGQLGDGSVSATPRTSPIQFGSSISRRFVDVAAGVTHTCGVTTRQEVYCAGSNSSGQIGNNGALSPPFSTPQRFGGTRSFTQVSVGSLHTCAVSNTDQKVYCAGEADDGRLGTGSLTDSKVAVQFATTGAASSKTFLQVSAGLNSTCALATDKFIYCAGSDTSFGLGDGGSAATQTTPVRSFNTGAALGKKFTQVAVSGTNHTCALGEDSLIYCVGNNSDYQLGDGSFANRTDPVLFGGVLSPTVGKTYYQLSTGSLYTCATGNDGAIYCTGNNSDGQQGSNSTTQRTKPDTSMLIP